MENMDKLINALKPIIKEIVAENEIDTELSNTQIQKQFIEHLKEEDLLVTLIERIKEDLETAYQGFEPQED